MECRSWAASAALALVLLLLLRIPSIQVPILNVDEADFAVESGVLLDGGTPYVDFVEKKPPLIYFVFAAAMKLVGRHALPDLRWLLLGWIFVTTCFVGALGSRLFGRAVGLVAMPLYAAAVSTGPPIDVHAVNAESLFLLPLCAGTYLVFRSRANKQLFAAGVLFALASLIKQQAGMQLPIAMILVWRMGGRLRSMAALVGGFALPWGIALGYLAWRNALYDFYFWTVEINRYYIAHGNRLWEGLEALYRALRTLTAASPGLWLFGVGGLLYSVTQKQLRPIAIWFGLSLVPISLGSRFFPHYFLQLFPPMVLACAWLLVAVAEPFWREGRAMVLVPAPLLAAVLWLRPALPWWRYSQDAEVLSIPHATPDARRLTDWIRRNTAPDARLLVWGYGSALYYLAQRPMATRFPYVTYHVGAVEATPTWWSPFRPSRPLEVPRAWDLLFTDLRRHPPAVVVETAQAGYFAFGKFPISRHPRLQQFLDGDYTRDIVAGFTVWRRR